MAADIRAAWARFADARQTRPEYTLFTHSHPEFPLPVRRPLPEPAPVVAIATPCKDAAGALPTYSGLIEALDYPRDRLHWLVLEGDSRDESFALARRMLERARGYRSTHLLKLDLGGLHGQAGRHAIGLQRARRSAIARCRNRLLHEALKLDADFVLFVDVDMSVIPSHALREALGWQAPIIVANCLRHRDDKVFDRNSFRYTAPMSDRSIRRYLVDGLFQPPTGFFRDYPRPDGPELAPLSCVGGTFLLIRRDVAEAGADFPEEPYQMHIETEGFALKAADLGFGAFMAPRLIVRHGDH